MNVVMVLHVLALILFFIAIVDWPVPGSSLRFIAAGLFLVEVANLVGK